MSFVSSNQGSRSHPSEAPGFGIAPDPFASISQHRGNDDHDGYAQAATLAETWANETESLVLTLKTLTMDSVTSWTRLMTLSMTTHLVVEQRRAEPPARTSTSLEAPIKSAVL